MTGVQIMVELPWWRRLVQPKRGYVFFADGDLLGAASRWGDCTLAAPIRRGRPAPDFTVRETLIGEFSEPTV